VVLIRYDAESAVGLMVNKPEAKGRRVTVYAVGPTKPGLRIYAGYVGWVLGLFAMAMGAGAQNKLPKFMGREVKVTAPARNDSDDPGISPPEPAKLCIEGPPREQCYTAPNDFGWDPSVEAVQLAKDRAALFFSAASGGVSGIAIHLALLVVDGGTLRDLFQGLDSVSEQSQRAFWSLPTVSDTKVFLIADYVWGPGEAHHEEHRYMVSVYAQDPEGSAYWLEDRYMTIRKYDVETRRDDVLASEQTEILARLKRVVAAQRAH